MSPESVITDRHDVTARDEDVTGECNYRHDVTARDEDVTHNMQADIMNMSCPYPILLQPSLGSKCCTHTIITITITMMMMMTIQI